jgi:hypothetical protein
MPVLEGDLVDELGGFVPEDVLDRRREVPKAALGVDHCIDIRRLLEQRLLPPRPVARFELAGPREGSRFGESDPEATDRTDCGGDADGPQPLVDADRRILHRDRTDPEHNQEPPETPQTMRGETSS